MYCGQKVNQVRQGGPRPAVRACSADRGFCRSAAVTLVNQNELAVTDASLQARSRRPAQNTGLRYKLSREERRPAPYFGLKLRINTTSVFTVPREKASCLPSRDQAKLKIR
jgi:hypothetical protein